MVVCGYVFSRLCYYRVVTQTVYETLTNPPIRNGIKSFTLQPTLKFGTLRSQNAIGSYVIGYIKLCILKGIQPSNDVVVNTTVKGVDGKTFDYQSTRGFAKNKFIVDFTEE